MLNWILIAVVAQVNDFQNWRAWSPWERLDPQLKRTYAGPPMAATNTTEFRFRPEGGGTAVTWTMSGQHNFMGKAFSLLMNVARLVGGRFDQGLANMKSLVEGRR